MTERAGGMRVFDGVFDGDDVAGLVFVDELEAGGKGGAFAGGGRAGKEDEAAAALEPFFDELDGEVERVEVGDVGLDVPEDGGALTELMEEIDAEAVAVAEEDGGIGVALVEVDGAEGPEFREEIWRNRPVGDAVEGIVDADGGGLTGVENEVGGLGFDGGFGEGVEVHGGNGPPR